MIKVLWIYLILLSSTLAAQSPNVDTIIQTSIYKSYFDVDIKQPLQLNYILYKGGGDCDRTKFRFINDTQIATATQREYYRSGFDMGHLANAEDFAFDCVKDELTFRFYNCLPQYANLNRGIWKKWETKIREESQTDSLLIICGAKFSGKKTVNNLYFPDECYKVVKSLSTGEIKWILWFKNVPKEAEKFFQLISVEELEDRLGYKIKLTY